MGSQWGSFEKEQAIALKTLVTMLLLHMLTEESFVKIENGEYQRLMIMGLLFIVSIYFPFLCNICFLLHHFLRKYFFRYWSNVLLKRMIRLI